MQPHRKLHPALTGLIIIVLIGIVTSVVIVVNNAQNSENESTSLQTPSGTQSPADNSQNNANSTDTSQYADGTYSAKASYVTPEGIESIDLMVTIRSGVISSAEVTASGNSDHAQEHQGDFIAGFKPLVEGKNVDEVRLSRVSGASLTSRAFNDALDRIREDARG